MSILTAQGSEMVGLSGHASQANGVATRKLPGSLDLGTYEQLDLALDPVQKTLWCMMQPKGPPSFTAPLLRDLKAMHLMVNRLCTQRQRGEPNPIRFCVFGSNVPGIFNLGGDLALFLKCVRAGDHQTLREYAHACVDATYSGVYSLDVPCISIAVVEGDALGGGFEAAMSFHVMIAERGVRMGMPEAMFNSFPGMGAYSFLSRKLGIAKTEKLILSGKIYSAEEFHEMGIVDILAEKGGGREAARQFIVDNERRHPLLYALNRVRRRVAPVAKEELLDVTDIWVETMMDLGEDELRRIDYLLRAQNRMLEKASDSGNAGQ